MAQRLDQAHELVVGEAILGERPAGERQVPDQAGAQELRGEEGAAGQRRVEAQQPAGDAGRVVVEGLAGHQHQAADPVRAAGGDH